MTSKRLMQLPGHRSGRCRWLFLLGSTHLIHCTFLTRQFEHERIYDSLVIHNNLNEICSDDWNCIRNSTYISFFRNKQEDTGLIQKKGSQIIRLTLTADGWIIHLTNSILQSITTMAGTSVNLKTTTITCLSLLPRTLITNLFNFRIVLIISF